MSKDRAESAPGAPRKVLAADALTGLEAARQGMNGDFSMSMAAAALTPGDAGCRKMLDALPAAIYATDRDGRLTYWNRAAERLWGRRPQATEERWCGSWRLFTPAGEPLQHDLCPMAEALREGRPVRGIAAEAERPDGSRVPFLPFPTPIYDDAGQLAGAVNLLVDMTEAKRTEQSLARKVEELRSLYQLTDRLHRASSLDDVHEAALDAIQRALGCSRASILLRDGSGALRFVAWRGLSDAYRAATDGHSPWAPDETDPAPITVNDAAQADYPPALQQAIAAEGIGALAFVPLLSGGRLVGKFMAYWDAPHRFSDGEVELATAIGRQLAFGVERLQAEVARRAAERQRDLLIAEVNHRVKNTLAAVISIAGQSFPGNREVEGSRRAFGARIRALAQTHSRLAEGEWSGVDFETLLRDELAPFCRPDGSSLRCSGPAVRLKPRAAVTLGMALHELASNAALHGALSLTGGSVEIGWTTVTDGSRRRLGITWTEQGGPAVRPPAHGGFGRLMLERAVAADLGGTVALDFAPAGFRCTIALPLAENLTEAA